MTEKLSQNELLSLTTEIVASHLSNNTVAVSDIPQLIKLVYGTLSTQGVEEEKEQPEKLMPAVPIKKSVMPDYIVCLEDGKKLKMLKRHLKTRYNMTPDEYRKRWGLADDYPMVAPAYAEQRSSLAKKIGLGTKPRARGGRSVACRLRPRRLAAPRPGIGSDWYLSRHAASEVGRADAPRDAPPSAMIARAWLLARTTSA